MKIEITQQSIPWDDVRPTKSYDVCHSFCTSPMHCTYLQRQLRT